MPKFRVVTDSTVDVTPEAIEKYGITIVPLSVLIDGALHQDGNESEKEAFLEKMKASKVLPKSSQPPAGLYVEKYEALTADGSEVLSIHVTHTLSGTVDCARQAADIANGNITVVDSAFCARAMAFQVLEAAKCAQEGLSIAETLPRLDAVRNRTVQYIAIANLENIVKGGRIGKTMGAITTLLNIKVNLQMIEGKLEMDAKGRGLKAIVKRYETILDSLKENNQEVASIGITHVGMAEYAETILENIQTAYPDADTRMAYASASVMTHAGPEAVSVQFLLKD